MNISSNVETAHVETFGLTENNCGFEAILQTSINMQLSGVACANYVRGSLKSFHLNRHLSQDHATARACTYFEWASGF